jgi:hypothetical protein
MLPNPCMDCRHYMEDHSQRPADGAIKGTCHKNPPVPIEGHAAAWPPIDDARNPGCDSWAPMAP